MTEKQLFDEAGQPANTVTADDEARQQQPGEATEGRETSQPQPAGELSRADRLRAMGPPDAGIAVTGVQFDSRGNVKVADLDGLYRLAKAYSQSDLVPRGFRGKPADVLVAMQMSMRCGLDAFTVMQGMTFIHGSVGINGQLAILLLNTSDAIKGRVKFRFDGEGDQYGCTAYVTEAATGEVVEGTKIDIAMATGEKWIANSKWNTMPVQMMKYRAASFLIRAEFPELLWGYQTTEEIEDVTEDHGDHEWREEMMRQQLADSK